MGVAAARRRRPDAGQPRVPAADWPHRPRRTTAALPAARRDPGRSVGGAALQVKAVAVAARPGVAGGGRPRARRLHGRAAALQRLRQGGSSLGGLSERARGAEGSVAEAVAVGAAANNGDELSPELAAMAVRALEWKERGRASAGEARRGRESARCGQGRAARTTRCAHTWPEQGMGDGSGHVPLLETKCSAFGQAAGPISCIKYLKFL